MENIPGEIIGIFLGLDSSNFEYLASIIAPFQQDYVPKVGGFMLIDLHTHTLFSDGVLISSELIHWAQMKGYRAIAITDHADLSNIDFIIPRVVKVCNDLNKVNKKIKAIP